MKITASILDYSYPSLDPAVWDDELKLYAYQKDFILRLIDKIYETYGLKQTETWVKDIVIIGSLTTSKWLFTSDLDVHIKVNIEAFRASNMSQGTIEQAFSMLDETRKKFDRAKILAPMTQHPIEFYFESSEIAPSSIEHVGIYSIIKDAWLKEPVMLPADLDFEQSKKDVVAQAEALAQTLDVSFGKIQRDIQRIDELEDVVKAWGRDKQQMFYAKVEQKLAEIEAEITKDLKIKQDLVDARHAGQDAVSEIEVKFKWLARFGFFSILSNLKTLLEQTGGQITTRELPLIDKIISEAAKKEIKNPGIWNGKPFWSGMADAHDGQIYEVHSYEEAEEAGFHHSHYTSTEAQVAMREGDAVFFWVDPNGTINTAWGNRVDDSAKAADAGLRDKISSQISIAKHASLREAFLKEAFEKETETDICVDLDKTIAKPAKFPEIGEPIEGAKEALAKLQDMGYSVIIYSCRADTEEGLDLIREYMDKHDLPYDSIFEGDKPFAKFYIDDHAIRFDNWDNVIKQVEKSEKKASLHIAANLADKYWLDSQGRAYNLGSEGVTHPAWVLENLELLKREGINVDSKDTAQISQEMFNQGWSRITTESDYDFAIEVADINNLPSYLDNFVAKRYTGGGIEIADLQGNYQDLSDPFPNLRKAIYQAKRLRNAASLKVAKTKKVKQGSYSCLLALVPHGLAQEIVEFGVRNIPDNKLFQDEEGKLGRELESHITVKYGLITNDAKGIRRSFNDEKPYKATLGKVRHFEPPEAEFDVVTVEIISDDLDKANKRITEDFECAEGLVSDVYHPHITIAYVKRGTAKDFIGSDIFEGKEIELDTFIFSPHKGNRTYFSISQDKESSFVLEINKTADFLPSLFNAPDNDWQFAEGGPDKEIALNPDSVSDDITEYEPCTTGKPRTKEVWRQFISMFSNPFSKKENVKIDSEYDPEMDQKEKEEMGLDQTQLEYSKGFYEPEKHDYPHNTTWDSLTQDGEPSKPTSVTYSPQISNEDNLDQNSPGGYPRRFMGKPKGEWFSNEGEVNNALIQMLKNRSAAIENMTQDINKIAITRRYALYIGGRLALRTLTRAKAIQTCKERFPAEFAKGNYEIKEEDFETASLKQAGDQSASVPDYLINEWKTEQIHDDVDSEPYVNHDQRDYPYGMHDSPENTAFNIGWAKDNQPAVVRLDTLENAAYRNDPWGIGEYNVTWYTSLPASDGIESTNPD